MQQHRLLACGLTMLRITDATSELALFWRVLCSDEFQRGDLDPVAQILFGVDSSYGERPGCCVYFDLCYCPDVALLSGSGLSPRFSRSVDCSESSDPVSCRSCSFIHLRQVLTMDIR